MKISIYHKMALAGYGLMAFASACQMKTDQKPNIIFILADDLGYGDISALNPHSKIQTPNVDTLCNDGMYFTEAHSNSSVSTPTRYGILTGRYCFRTSLKKWTLDGYSEPLIESGRQTIASMLRKSGYTTACIGKWHLGLEFQKKDINKPLKEAKTDTFANINYARPLISGPNHLGFDYSYILPASLDMPPYVLIRNHQVVDPEIVWTNQIFNVPLDSARFGWDKYLIRPGDIYCEKGVWWRKGEISRSFEIENILPNFVNEATQFMTGHVKNSKEPFFLYLPLTAPHTPWLPSGEYLDTSGAGKCGDFVAQVDGIVSTIRQTVRDLGIEDNTIIVFTSDNGPFWPASETEKYQHDAGYGRAGMKGDIYDGGHRMPLVVCWPGKVKAGSASRELVCLTDFYATFAALTGHILADNEAEDSYNLLPIWLGKSKEPVRETIIHHSGAGYFAIRDKQWKLTFGLGSGGFTRPAYIIPAQNGPKGQLYDMTVDSLETTNVWLDHPEVVERLTRVFEDQLTSGHSRKLIF